MPTFTDPENSRSKKTVRKRSPTSRQKTSRVKNFDNSQTSDFQNTHPDDGYTNASIPESEAASKHNPLWMMATFLLLLLFGGYILYEYHPGVRTSIENIVLGKNFGQMTQQTQETIVTLPLTIVHDPADIEGIATIKNKFIKSLIDPEQGLQSTVIKELWLDPKSPEGKQYIVESDAKYFPIAFFDKNLEQHPQFLAINKYLKKIGGHYYFHLYPLKHIKTPGIDGGHVQGADPKTAPIVILEYASFTCTFCKEMDAILKKGMQEYPGKIALVYKHFDRKPFNGTHVDNLLAQGSECANEQNKFWPMHDELFADQEGFIKFMEGSKKNIGDAVREYLEEKTKKLKIQTQKFLDCYDSKKHEQASEITTAQAMEYGINVSGTPAFFINGKFHDGSFHTYENFQAELQAALTAAENKK